VERRQALLALLEASADEPASQVPRAPAYLTPPPDDVPHPATLSAASLVPLSPAECALIARHRQQAASPIIGAGCVLPSPLALCAD
jgi:hypothetical protein